MDPDSPLDEQRVVDSNVRMRERKRRWHRGTCVGGAELRTIDTTIRGDERHDTPSVRLECMDSHADAGKVVFAGGELLESRLCTGRAEKRGDLFHLGRPHKRSVAPATERASRPLCP